LPSPRPRPHPSPSSNLSQVVVTLTAASLNHRDLFIRQHLYPGTSFGIPLLADGVGIVTRTGSSPAATSWLHKRVLLNPGTGWASSPDGPEDPAGYAILGGTTANPRGTLADHIVLPAAELEECPPHLSDAEAAALPLTGLTAWRAFRVKSGAAAPGRNVLITGIGGGVALMALLFAVGAGCNVYVSSSSADKLARARELGARGGVDYRDKDWGKKLLAQLPKDRKFLDAIIDGAGGDVLARATRLLKPGGVVAVYGMTIAPTMAFPMGAVLKNIDVRGCTMGSRKEFKEMVQWVREKGARPVVSKVVRGLEIERVEELFEDMKAGRQFGKLVVLLGEGKEEKARL
jgi:NADPH:quinone reductase-like Zn-dependent oxidoreductase